MESSGKQQVAEATRRRHRGALLHDIKHLPVPNPANINLHLPQNTAAQQDHGAANLQTTREADSTMKTKRQRTKIRAGAGKMSGGASRGARCSGRRKRRRSNDVGNILRNLERWKVVRRRGRGLVHRNYRVDVENSFLNQLVNYRPITIRPPGPPSLPRWIATSNPPTIQRKTTEPCSTPRMSRSHKQVSCRTSISAGTRCSALSSTEDRRRIEPRTVIGKRKERRKGTERSGKGQRSVGRDHRAKRKGRPDVTRNPGRNPMASVVDGKIARHLSSPSATLRTSPPTMVQSPDPILGQTALRVVTTRNVNTGRRPSRTRIAAGRSLQNVTSLTIVRRGGDTTAMTATGNGRGRRSWLGDMSMSVRVLSGSGTGESSRSIFCEGLLYGASSMS